jgi:hypothetical protein
LCFGFCEFAAEDDRKRLSAFDVIAEHHGNFFHDAAHERCYLNLAVFIGFHDSRDAKLCGDDAVCKRARCESALSSNHPAPGRFPGRSRRLTLVREMKSVALPSSPLPPSNQGVQVPRSAFLFSN